MSGEITLSLDKRRNVMHKNFNWEITCCLFSHQHFQVIIKQFSLSIGSCMLLLPIDWIYFPGCSLHICGSTSNGLATNESDIDLCLLLPKTLLPKRRKVWLKRCCLFPSLFLQSEVKSELFVCLSIWCKEL
jgi:hypothetical protein